MKNVVKALKIIINILSKFKAFTKYFFNFFSKKISMESIKNGYSI